MMKILLLMILCHLIDDYVLQGVLAKLKQKTFWETYGEMYANDYIIALIEHSLEWSIMIMLPAMFLTQISNPTLLILIVANTIVHSIVDNLKANELKINLIQDQIIHFIQIILTFYIINITC